MTCRTRGDGRSNGVRRASALRREPGRAQNEKKSSCGMHGQTWLIPDRPRPHRTHGARCRAPASLNDDAAHPQPKTRSPALQTGPRRTGKCARAATMFFRTLTTRAHDLPPARRSVAQLLIALHRPAITRQGPRSCLKPRASSLKPQASFPFDASRRIKRGIASSFPEFPARRLA